jgi:hypothetical protein
VRINSFVASSRLLGERDQLIRWQPAVALVHRLGQRVRDASTQPDHGRLLDAELHCDRISGLKTDASNIPGESIGVLRHDLDGARPIGLENAHRSRRPNPVAVKEDHDLSYDLLLGPDVRNPLGPNRANAGHLAKPIGLGLDDV